MGIEERQQSREIDGVTYVVNPLPFGIGKTALLRFTKIAAPVLSSALEGGAAAIAAIAMGLGEEDLTYFAKTFGNASWYVADGKNVPLVYANQDAHFELRYMAFFEWLAFCVEVSFGPFFGGLLKRAGVVASRQVTATTDSTLKAALG